MHSREFSLTLSLSHRERGPEADDLGITEFVCQISLGLACLLRNPDESHLLKVVMKSEYLTDTEPLHNDLGCTIPGLILVEALKYFSCRALNIFSHMIVTVSCLALTLSGRCSSLRNALAHG